MAAISFNAGQISFNAGTHSSTESREPRSIYLLNERSFSIMRRRMAQFWEDEDEG
jgi:hypothetical protein